MVVERLRIVLDEIAKENHYDNQVYNIEEVSSGGANYTSKLYQATISSPLRNDMHLFAKVCNINEEFREHLPNNSIFDTEFLFYKELNKIYENIQERNGVPEEHRLIVPKFYKCNPNHLEEVLVLENLAVKGFTSYNRTVSITWEYAAAAVEQLAKFHALSLAYQFENPEQFEKTTDKLSLIFKVGEQLRDMFTNLLTNVFNLIKEENKERFKKFFDSIDASEYWVQCFQAKCKKVIIHTDYRMSNLMHRRRNGKLQIIPVDFQTLYGGCPVADLMYFIYTGSDAEFRKYHYANIIELYYTKLSASMRNLNVDIDKVYPKVDFEEDLKAVKLFGLVAAVFVLPIVCVDTEDAPAVEDEGIKLTDFVVKHSELYRTRLNGIVDDYIRWGLL